MPDSLQEQKASLRQRLRELRKAETDVVDKSERVFRSLYALPQVQDCETILFYVSVRDELPTHKAIEQALASQTKVVVPYCSGEVLKLVSLQQFDELVPGAFGILEPSETLKQDASRDISPQQIAAALVPGLGFDASGNRIGYGKGYYDRLLANLSKDCLRIGLAYNCQIVPSIPHTDHDEKVHMIVTESLVIDSREAARN